MDDERGDRNGRVLAEVVKQTHEVLRLRAQAEKETGRQDDVWARHVCLAEEQEEKLSYADAMSKLAREHWRRRGDVGDDGGCRIAWIRRCVVAYFFEGGKEKIARKTCVDSSPGAEEPTGLWDDDQIRLLDVGSCYNPLAREFQSDCRIGVTGIDLRPWRPADGHDDGFGVLKCDFVRVPVGDAHLADEAQVLQLKEGGFHVLVFSLLLDYLPLPRFRLRVCEKAHRLLTDFGLLVIVTPDSCHQGKNEFQMKCWRYALGRIGFARVKIEKLRHVRCMAYVKVSSVVGSTYLKREVELAGKRFRQAAAAKEDAAIVHDDELLFIPQDSSTRKRRAAVNQRRRRRQDDDDDDDNFDRLHLLEAFSNYDA